MPRNIENNKKYRRARGTSRRRFIETYKNVPCMDCGIKYPVECMDFDHRENKFKQVSNMTGHSYETILKEISKCDVVCSNCHRIRTKVRRESYSIMSTTM